MRRARERRHDDGRSTRRGRDASRRAIRARSRREAARRGRGRRARRDATAGRGARRDARGAVERASEHGARGGSTRGEAGAQRGQCLATGPSKWRLVGNWRRDIFLPTRARPVIRTPTGRSRVAAPVNRASRGEKCDRNGKSRRRGEGKPRELLAPDAFSRTISRGAALVAGRPAGKARVAFRDVARQGGSRAALRAHSEVRWRRYSARSLPRGSRNSYSITNRVSSRRSCASGWARGSERTSG